MKPILEISNVGKKYKISHTSGSYLSLRERMMSKFKSRTETAEDFWALQNISFSVEPGESIGIIGRNGAGKSTLLKILSRITPPTMGTIVSRGRIASLLEVGTGFHPELTGRENVFFNGSLLGMRRKEIESKFDEIVDFSETEKFLDTPLKHYSSGMQLRLAFAVAAFLEPEVLIIDEVLAVGDAEFQKKCMGKMENVSKSGRTILFVSHNMSAVQNLCHRGILLSGGVQVFSGPVDDAIAKYVDNFDKQSSPLHWRKSNAEKDKKLEILEVKAALTGMQPHLDLHLECLLNSNENHSPAFIAFDILSDDGVALSQAIPSEDRFISFTNGQQRVEAIISLPPFIPGSYRVSVWVGPNYYETFDWQQAIISFTVENSPMAGRTLPHSKKNGFLIPSSSIVK